MRSRLLLATGLAGLALLTPSASAATTQSCGNDGVARQHIKASGTTCRIAKRVAEASNYNAPQPQRIEGYSCRWTKRKPAGRNYTCTKPGKRITWISEPYL